MEKKEKIGLILSVVVAGFFMFWIGYGVAIDEQKNNMNFNEPIPASIPDIPNQYLTLDQMPCSDIMNLTDTMMKTGDRKFTGDINADNYKSYAFNLRNKCLQSVSQYEMIILENGSKKYRVNGTWSSLEMVHGQ